MHTNVPPVLFFFIDCLSLVYEREHARACVSYIVIICVFVCVRERVRVGIGVTLINLCY